MNNKQDVIQIRFNLEGKDAEAFRAFKERTRVNTSKDAALMLLSFGYKWEALVAQKMGAAER